MNLDASSSRRFSAGSQPTRWGALAIVILTIVAYWPALHAGFIWDDDSYVTENRLLHDLDGLRHIWIPGRTTQTRTPQYYPVVFTTFWCEYQLWEDYPFGYHLINVLLHAANTLLVWRLCTRLGLPGGWLIAAIFAVHPVHVESVAWITERKNVLSGSFYLSAALAYLRFDELRETAPEGRAWRWYAASITLFILALLSKTVTCSLPAALILIMLFQRKKLSVARLVPLLPMFAIGLLLALNTAAVERAHVGAEGEEFAFTFIERLIIASRALVFYPWKLFWPHPIMFIYPRWAFDTTAWSSYLPMIAVGFAAFASVIAFIRGWRGPSLALAFYAGTIFPALGFINIYPMRFSFVADHFQYLASLGIIALLAAMVAPFGRNVLMVAGLLVLPMLSILTFLQARTYASAETVYRDTLSKNWNAWMPHNNLANILIRRDPAEAEQHYREALRIKPDHYTAQSNLAEALRLQRRYDEAVLEIRQAIQMVKDRMTRDGRTTPPKFLATDFVQLAQLELARDNLAAAEDAIGQAVSIDPRVSGAVELGQIIRARSRPPRSAE